MVGLTSILDPGQLVSSLLGAVTLSGDYDGGGISPACRLGRVICCFMHSGGFSFFTLAAHYVTFGCPSVRPSVCPVDRRQQQRCLLLSAGA